MIWKKKISLFLIGFVFSATLGFCSSVFVPETKATHDVAPSVGTEQDICQETTITAQHHNDKAMGDCCFEQKEATETGNYFLVGKFFPNSVLIKNNFFIDKEKHYLLNYSFFELPPPEKESLATVVKIE